MLVYGGMLPFDHTSESKDVIYPVYIWFVIVCYWCRPLWVFGGFGVWTKRGCLEQIDLANCEFRLTLPRVEEGNAGVGNTAGIAGNEC